MEAKNKANAKGKGKKGKGKAEPDEPVVDEPVARPESTVKEEKFNLEIPDQFKRALQQKISRPFIFGPVEFDGLDLTDEERVFDRVEEAKKVEKALEGSAIMPSGLCIHGYKVLVKNRNLKRRSSLLKHARFLGNLEVQPVHPEPPEVPENAS